MAQEREGGKDRMAGAGVIRAGEVYSLDEFMRRTHLKVAALRAARRQGLRVCYAHSHGYIVGADWIAYLRTVNQSRDS